MVSNLAISNCAFRISKYLLGYFICLSQLDHIVKVEENCKMQINISTLAAASIRSPLIVICNLLLQYHLKMLIILHGYGFQKINNMNKSIRRNLYPIGTGYRFLNSLYHV